MHQLPLRAARQHREAGRTEVAQQRHERVREDGVGHARLDRVGAADGHGPVRMARLIGDERGQATLADAPLAREQHYGGMTSPRAFHGRAQLGQLGSAADQRETGKGLWKQGRFFPGGCRSR